MRDSVIIDKVYAGLLQVVTNPDYEFHTLKGSWGYRSSDGYQQKVLSLSRNVRK